MMIFSLVAMIGLAKCCITSACLQWLCHSGERIVARGPLVYEVKQRKSQLVPGWVAAVLDFVEDPVSRYNTNNQCLHFMLLLKCYELYGYQAASE